jgi:hypothetical protein
VHRKIAKFNQKVINILLKTMTIIAANWEQKALSVHSSQSLASPNQLLNYFYLTLPRIRAIRGPTFFSNNLKAQKLLIEEL